MSADLAFLVRHADFERLERIGEYPEGAARYRVELSDGSDFVGEIDDAVTDAVSCIRDYEAGAKAEAAAAAAGSGGYDPRAQAADEAVDALKEAEDARSRR